MAEILKIDGNKVKIGDDDGKVITVDIDDVNYDSPTEGDKVKVYKDGKKYIVIKTSSSASMDGIFEIDDKGYRHINKHLFVWVGTFVAGGFGVDRFLRGQIGTGVCKLLFSWLTLGIWPLVDFIVALSKAYGGAYSNTEEITFDNMGNWVE
jgi:TM2 domain-containing membrane protein YozV